MNGIDLARYIEHTSLKPNLEKSSVIKLCEEAMHYNFATVCIPPYFVTTAFDILKDVEDVGICTVVDFPFGYSSAFSKVESAKKSIDNGADEIDAVINIPALKNGDWKTVIYDLEALRHSTKINNKILKVIIETCYLTTEEKVSIIKLCIDTEIDFIKTSTGFGPGGATVSDIKLIKGNSNGMIKIKASGGINNYSDTMTLIKAGADRIGTSSGIKITDESHN